MKFGSFAIATILMLAWCLPASAHVVGVSYALPPTPEYERILDEPVTLPHALQMRRYIQEARDKRTGVKTAHRDGLTVVEAIQNLHLDYCRRHPHRTRGHFEKRCKYGNTYQSLRNARIGAVEVAAPRDKSIAAIQQRRADRTEHLRVIQRVEHELFRPVVWERSIVEPTALTLGKGLEYLAITQEARDRRTGVKSEPITQKTLKSVFEEIEIMTRPDRLRCGSKRAPGARVK